MPELPEVEIVKRQLCAHLVGCVVDSVEIKSDKVVRGDLSSIVNSEIISVSRRGKGLIIDFDNGISIAVHLKMTGQIIYREAEWQSGKDPEMQSGEDAKKGNGDKNCSMAKWLNGSNTKEQIYKLSEKVGELPGKHTHVIFNLKSQSSKCKAKESSDASLFYNDIRKFGWLHVIATSEVPNHSFFQTLGPEPLVDLEYSHFLKILKNSKAPIKTVIMDQRKIAGVGNIYANDALWMAKIHPRRLAQSLSTNEIKLLYKTILEVLERSISVGGASDKNYVNALGGEGAYQKEFLIYRKDGEECATCGTKIEKFVLGGRGTYICPTCQKGK